MADAGLYSEDERKRARELAGEFAGAAAVILADILHRELSGKISEVRRHELINAFLVACVSNEESHRVTRDAMERVSDELTKLRKKLATKTARKTRAENSKATKAIVLDCASKWRREHPKQGSKRHTAKAILDEVKTKLAANGLRPLTTEAIRRMI